MANSLWLNTSASGMVVAQYLIVARVLTVPFAAPCVLAGWMATFSPVTNMVIDVSLPRTQDLL
jgi:hypothetical protein